jgi:hypothetical protein
MPNRALALLAAAVTAFAVALPATAAKKKPPQYDRLAPLIGKEEAPGPGDPDGYGAADFRIVGNKVCFRILAKDIEPVAAAHIHKAPPGQAGPVVVDLFSAKGPQQTLPPRISGCAKTSAAIAKDIARNSDDYYVNVHNEPFPNGALRGQLSK